MENLGIFGDDGVLDGHVFITHKILECELRHKQEKSKGSSSDLGPVLPTWSTFI